MSKTLQFVIILLTIVTIILILGLIMFFLRNKNGWECTEKGCDYVIDGKYTSKEMCMKECNSDKESGEDSDQDSELDDEQNDEYNKWSCTSNYDCVKSNQGWNSYNDCKNNCLPTYNYTYIPQSLYYDQPLYWSPRVYRRRRVRGIGRGRGRFRP
jgi:hypothetical protein